MFHNSSLEKPLVCIPSILITSCTVEINLDDRVVLVNECVMMNEACVVRLSHETFVNWFFIVYFYELNTVAA